MIIKLLHRIHVNTSGSLVIINIILLKHTYFFENITIPSILPRMN